MMRHLLIGVVEFESDVEWKKDIELHPNDNNIVDACFEHFCPCVKGHSKLIYGHNSSRNSPYCSSVKYEKIFFYQLDHVDPDCLVKAFYLMMIASVLEVLCGMDNLWLKLISSGKRDHPNFGRYAEINYFKVLALPAHCFFASKKW